MQRKIIFLGIVADYALSLHCNQISLWFQDDEEILFYWWCILIKKIPINSKNRTHKISIIPTTLPITLNALPEKPMKIFEAVLKKIEMSEYIPTFQSLSQKWGQMFFFPNILDSNSSSSSVINFEIRKVFKKWVEVF